MKTALIIALFAVAGLLWLVFGGGEAQPIRHKDLSQERLSELVGYFLAQGIEGATLTVQEGDTGRFFQLRRETHNGRTRLRSDYPYTAWSEPYYTDFRRALDSLNVPVTEHSGASAIDMQGQVHKTLVVDFGTDTPAVVAAIRILFGTLYGLNTETDAELLIRGLHPIRRKQAKPL